MQISFVDPLSRSWERMRQILFDPFSLAKWLVLGFSAWLAGLASGGSNSMIWDNSDDDFDHGHKFSGFDEAMESIVDNLVWMPLIMLGVLVLLALVLAIFWISSRAKFIFLDNEVNDRAQIVEPWGRFKRIGDSLFLWRAGFYAVLFAVLLVVAGVIFLPAASLSFSDALRGLSFAGIFIGSLTVAVVAAVAFFITLFLENFVVPIMYKFDLKAMEAWNYFLPWLRAHAGWFVVYGILFLVAAIAVHMMIAILCLLTCCIILIPYVGTVILLPVWVLYRIYSIEFLAQFHPDFDLFLGGPEPAPVIADSDDDLEDPKEWSLDDDTT
jgi:hypothetical protein